jgi:hypothetical protein
MLGAGYDRNSKQYRRGRDLMTNRFFHCRLIREKTYHEHGSLRKVIFKRKGKPDSSRD